MNNNLDHLYDGQATNTVVIGMKIWQIRICKPSRTSPYEVYTTGHDFHPAN